MLVVEEPVLPFQRVLPSVSRAPAKVTMLPNDPFPPREQRLVSRNHAPRPFMGRREWVSVMMIFFALAVVVLAFTPDSCEGDPQENPGNPLAMSEMAYPDLSALESAITQSDLLGFEDRISEYMERPDRIFGQPLPIQVGWAQRRLQRDLANPPIPMRVTASDIAQASSNPQFHITNGSRVVLSGQLIEKHPFVIRGNGELEENREDSARPVVEEWQRLLIEVAPKVFAQVLARDAAAALPYGARVNVVGRYLGIVATPIAGQEEAATVDTVLLPTMAAWEGSEASEESASQISSLLQFGTQEAPGSAPFRTDPTIFEGVDDNGLRLERRPYYYLLGLVLRDPTTPGAYDGIIDAVENERELHHRAEDFRGHPVTVSGQVLRAWEDWDVSRDRPFGVIRVIRMWIWAYVPERKEMEIDGEMRTLTTSQLGVFEVAAMVTDDRPLPEPRDTISATGRFLKIQRYRTSDNFVFNRGSLADADRALSDSVYFKFIVSNEFEVTPPREEVSIIILKVGFLVVFASLLVFILYLIDRDRVRMDDYKKPLRKIRKARRDWQGQRRREAAAAEGDASATTDEAAASSDHADDHHGQAVDGEGENVNNQDDESETRP